MPKPSAAASSRTCPSEALVCFCPVGTCSCFFGLCCALLVVASSACISVESGSTSGASTTWDCLEPTPGQSCSCTGTSSGSTTISNSGPSDPSRVQTCTGYSCCFTTEATNGPVQCQCEQSTSCQAEVSSRRGAKLVSQCPPGGQQAAVQCAKQSENCGMDYLSQNNLVGCCSGLACKMGSSGIPLCQPGTADEIRLSRECAVAAYNGMDSVKITDPVQTSSGPTNVTTVYVGLSGASSGPGGCLASIVITLDTCDLSLGPARDASGAYLVTAPTVCTLGNLGLGQEQTIAGTATFDGLACQGGVEPFCYAGTFEFRLTSTLTDPLVGLGLSDASTGPPQQNLTGQPFHVTGTFCPSENKAAASCGG